MEVISLTSSSESDPEHADDDIEIIPLDASDEEEKGTKPRQESNPSKAISVDVEIEQFAGNREEEDVSILLEIPSVIPRKNPDTGYVVYGQERSALHKWHMGVVNAGFENPVFNIMEYDVKMDKKKVKYVNGEYKFECRPTYRYLPASLMAYHVMTPFKLPVGSRVIAVYYNPLESNNINQDNYFVGIIAEPLKPRNNRYLIFFDNGSVQYTKHNDVRLVYASSVKVWEDVYPDSQQFIEDYLKKYPEVPLMSVTKNSRITAEWNGKPWICKVVDMDHSLVKLQFECSGHTEWIYRGSQRLLKYQYQPQRFGPNEELVQHASTSGLPYRIETNEIFGEIEEYIPLLCPIDSCVEHEGKMEKLDIPSPKRCENADPLMVAHLCTQRCIGRFKAEDYHGVPPLAVPFHLGFVRFINDHNVYYKGPCGKVLPDEKHLHRFLVRTNSELGIDHFTFQTSVRCATKFVPKTIHFKIRDISFGVNIMPIECVNSLGMDMPGYFAYTNELLPSEDIKFNEDVGFLTCCDCIDDCQDRQRCSCWQLTLSGCSFYNQNPRFAILKGYEYRRLEDFVVSGIYECNKGCKCRKTCLNRVIQNIGARFPLQVFKTSKKGWAIRPLCDIPMGAFICTYGGQVLTESKANEDGKKFGDEYLAAMDFIEVLEKHKSGYESSPDISDSDSDDEDLNSSVNSGIVCEKRIAIRKTTASVGPSCNTKGSSKKPKKSKRKSTRQYFGRNEQIYVMDAKTTGNIGRYLNHSCDPNVFVQNVFVDSHDIRFPRVSFFASQTIKAGTELTWNYSYEVGSIPGKVMNCYCAKPKCKRRML